MYEDLIALLVLPKLGHIKVILYARHHMCDLTHNDFQYGRRLRDGSRVDSGTGMRRPSISESLEYGVTRGFLIKKPGFEPTEIVRLLRAKAPQELSEGNAICNWCHGRTISLQSHHYPVSEKDGGTSTIDVCANCHFEYHTLLNTPVYIAKGQ